MDITQIENLVSTLSATLGYTPLVASETGIERSISAYPTAWIQLPQVLYVEGRTEGIIGHKITIYLIDDLKGFSFEDQSTRLSEMQEDMIEIMTQLSSCDGIVEVSDMTITPKTIPTTRHDNIAQLCQATIVSYF